MKEIYFMPHWRLVKGSILILLCIVSYWNSLSGELLHDDVFAIKDNQDVRSDTPLNQLLINDFWGKPMTDPTSHKSYRPFTVLTFRINYAIHGLDPLGYHIFNVIAHIVCTLLFWWMSTVIVFGTCQSDMSFQAAALFAVHPVHTEAVSGVVGRADILSCICFISSFLIYHHCLEEFTSWKSIAKFTISLIFGASAMLCKENGFTIFGILIMYEVFQLFCTQKNKDAGHITDIYPQIFRITCLIIVTGLLLAFRIKILHGQLPPFSAQDNPASFASSVITRGLTYSYLFYFNVKLLIAPVVLCYDWQMGSIPLVESVTDVRNIGTSILVIYLCGLCWSVLITSNIEFKRVTYLGLLLIIFPFLPASNIFFRVGFVVAERILYIPSLGYCIILVHGLNCLYTRWKHLKKFQISVIYLLVILFSIRTILRNPVWHTRESLFRSGIETVPNNAKAHYNYANLLKDANRKEEAIFYYRAALKLCDSHASAHNNLGTLLSGSEAEYHFRQAIKHNPQHFKAFFNLGNNLWDSGKTTKAETSFRESLRINPNFTDALQKLSSVLTATRNYDEAESLMKRVLDIKPDSSDVLNNYAVLLKTMSKIDEAIEVYEQAISIDPTHSIAMAGLAKIHRSLGNTNKAEELFKKSLSIKPDALVYQSLGALYYNTGQTSISQQMFNIALKMEPGNPDILCSYAQVNSHLSNKEEIINLLKNVLQQQTDIYCVHFNLAVLFSTKNNHEALEHSSKAIQLASSDSEVSDAYSMHGTILKDLKRLSESAKSYQKAIESSPATVSLWINLGAVMHLMGNYTQAEVYYKTAEKFDPNNTLVQDNLEKVRRIIKRYPKN